MTHTVPIANDVTDGDIVRAIQAWLARQHRYGSVVGLRRRPWEYATSAALELVTAVLKDGSERELVLKHLGPRHVSEKSRRVKPSFVVDPQREIEVYRRLLAPLQVGPRLVGFTISPQTGIYWLLIEHVHGHPLYEAGELATWAAVARWLGALHERLATLDSQPLRQEARLIEYDREWYTVWLKRALRFFASGDPSHSRRSRAALRWLADRYDKVVDHLMSLPATIVHGEFYPSNVLVAGTPDSPVVYPIDWETTSIGPGIIDLAALTSGEWREQDRRAVITAYLSCSAVRVRATLDEVAQSVEYAHIHLAIQWLGWFGRRQAPAAHARDWLADAADRAEALRL